MASYSTGSVKVKVGSDAVVGYGTAFKTYISVGDIFKLNSSRSWYEVAAVSNATQLTLTTRYNDADNELSVNSNVASVGPATTIYTGTLTNTPVIRNKVSITASEIFVDNGAGVLAGNASGTGTVDYDTGVWSIALGDPINATYNINASYHSGLTLNGMPYQIVRDYTPKWKFPEISPNDTNFADIYTKAMRKIDGAIAASLPFVSAATVTATNISVKYFKPDWTYITNNYSASPGEYILADTRNKKLTLTLPNTISRGDRVRVRDFAGNFNSSNLDVVASPNGLRNNASRLQIDINWYDLEFTYSGNATIGWEF